MPYLDNLRSSVIFLVVLMHSNVTYSGLGSWYYVEGDPSKLDFPSLAAFAVYGAYTQAWFMGILFFVAAYFAAGSLAARGPRGFMRERLFRLGLPLLVYVFLIDPFIGYFLVDYGGARERLGAAEAYLDYLASFRWLGSTGPLWFAETLLSFSGIYALARAVRPRRTVPGPAPGTARLVGVVAATGLAAFAVRLVQPIGASVANLQLGYFASYVALFLLGLHAGERGWLPYIPERSGLRWLIWTAALSFPLWGFVMVAGGALRGDDSFAGGPGWQSFAYAMWEAWVAVGFSLGLVVFFRKFLDKENRLTRILSGNSFGVYVFHAPVLVGLSTAAGPWRAPMIVKHLVAGPAAFLLTLALSALVLKRVPGLRKILK